MQFCPRVGFHSNPFAQEKKIYLWLPSHQRLKVIYIFKLYHTAVTNWTHLSPNVKNGRLSFQFKSTSGAEEIAVTEVIKVCSSRKRRQSNTFARYIFTGRNSAHQCRLHSAKLHLRRVNSEELRCIDLQVGPRVLKIVSWRISFL